VAEIAASAGVVAVNKVAQAVASAEVVAVSRVVPAVVAAVAPVEAVGIAAAAAVGIAPVEAVGIAPVEVVGIAPVEVVGIAPVEAVGIAPVEAVGIAPAGDMHMVVAPRAAVPIPVALAYTVVVADWLPLQLSHRTYYKISYCHRFVCRILNIFYSFFLLSFLCFLTTDGCPLIIVFRPLNTGRLLLSADY